MWFNNFTSQSTINWDNLFLHYIKVYVDTILSYQCVWLIYSVRIEASNSIPSTLYEFPNGYNMHLAIEKYKLTEGLFDASSDNVKVSQYCNSVLDNIYDWRLHSVHMYSVHTFLY